MAKSKSTKKTTQGDDSAELVTPEEHAKTNPEAAIVEGEGITVGEDGIPILPAVSDPEVPDDVEVAARSADMEKASSEHRKTFVLGPNPYKTSSNPYTEGAGFDHEPNKAATRQYAIDNGLWPTGDVRHVSTKRHPDGESWVLTYAVDVIPANDAPDGSQTPHVVDDDGEAENAINYAPPPEAPGDEPTAS